jgi:hypothetical protein
MLSLIRLLARKQIDKFSSDDQDRNSNRNCRSHHDAGYDYEGAKGAYQSAKISKRSCARSNTGIKPCHQIQDHRSTWPGCLARSAMGRQNSKYLSHRMKGMKRKPCRRRCFSIRLKGFKRILMRQGRTRESYTPIPNVADQTPSGLSPENGLRPPGRPTP